MLKYQHDAEVLFNGLFERADELSDDPLQQMLIFLKLLSESMAALPDLHPGCLVAVFNSANQIMNQSVRDVTADCLLSWRQMFENRFKRIAERYKPKENNDSSQLADMLSTIIEGGIIV
jgi:hypothetical protein